MKRLVAILSMVLALTLSGVAAAPVSAGTIPYFAATFECENTSGNAKYTMTVVAYGHTYTQTFTVRKATCGF